MTTADERPAGYYRRVAGEITELAGKTQDAEVRQELLELAERFRRLAAHVERRGPNGRGPP